MPEKTQQKQKAVVIYTTPTCHFCHMAKEYFDSKGIKYESKDVTLDMQAQQEMIQKSGQLGVPVIDIGGEITVGFNLAKINEMLNLS